MQNHWRVVICILFSGLQCLSVWGWEVTQVLKAKNWKTEQKMAYSQNGTDLYIAAHDGIKTLSRAENGTLLYSSQLEFTSDEKLPLTEVVGINIIDSDQQVIILTSNLLLVCRRDSETGDLTRTETIKNVFESATGLWISPDELELYVTDKNSHSLLVFDRNPISGKVLFKESFKNGVEGVAGLMNPAGVSGSYDGEQVFVLGACNEAIGVFDRNSNNNTLTFRKAVGLHSFCNDRHAPSWIRMSPEDDQLFAYLFSSDKVFAFDRNTTTGELEEFDFKLRAPSARGTKSILPNDIQFGFDGRKLFSTLEEKLYVFRRNHNNATVTLENEYRTVMDEDIGDYWLHSPTLAIVPGSEYNRIATGGRVFKGGIVIEYIYSPDEGGLSNPQRHLDVRSENGINLASGEGTLIVSNDQSQLYLAGENQGKMSFFSRNTTTGAVSFNASKSLWFSHFYSGFAMNKEQSCILLIGGDGRRENVFPLFSTYDYFCQTYSFDGQSLGQTRAITSSTKNAPFSKISTVSDFGYFDATYAITDKFIARGLLIGFHGNCYIIADGRVSDDSLEDAGVDGLNGIRDIAGTSDGDYIYVASNRDNSLVIFNRFFSPLIVFKDGQDGVRGIKGARSIATSHDEKNIYIAGYEDSSVAPV